jgi:hypothetical protein
MVKVSARVMRLVGCGALLAVLHGGCAPQAGVPLAGGGPPAALIGVWRAPFTDPQFGPAQVELILQQDGSFLQQTAYQSGALVTLFGTYRVFTAETLLRLDIERGEPAQACGPLGCTDILYPAGESYAYTLVNNDALQLTLINCDPNNPASVCTFNYARINPVAGQ